MRSDSRESAIKFFRLRCHLKFNLNMKQLQTVTAHAQLLGRLNFDSLDSHSNFNVPRLNLHFIILRQMESDTASEINVRQACRKGSKI
jgi:hypothetical protein